MNANKIVVSSVSVYVLCFLCASLYFLNTKFTGNDPAGNGMAKGLTFIYGLGLLILIAIAVTIANTFFYKGITQWWVKLYFFVPLVMPFIVFFIEILEVGRSSPPSLDKQAHRLAIEVRSPLNLDEARMTFRSSKGGTSKKLTFNRSADGYHYYQCTFGIYYESSRWVSIVWDGSETLPHTLEIPYKPKPAPFSPWSLLNDGHETLDSLVVEIRYMITRPLKAQ